MDRFTFGDDYVRRLREHDGPTEEHFYGHFNPRLFNFLRNRLRSMADVEETRQDTFLRVLTEIRADKLRDGRKLPGFVFGICRNVLREHWRDPVTENLDDHAEPALDTPDQEQKMITEELKRAVHRVLKKLKPPDGDILRAVLRDTSKDEICERFGVTRDYLRVLLHRAYKHFRDKFSPDDETKRD